MLLVQDIRLASLHRQSISPVMTLGSANSTQLICSYCPGVSGYIAHVRATFSHSASRHSRWVPDPAALGLPIGSVLQIDHGLRTLPGGSESEEMQGLRMLSAGETGEVKQDRTDAKAAMPEFSSASDIAQHSGPSHRLYEREIWLSPDKQHISGFIAARSVDRSVSELTCPMQAVIVQSILHRRVLSAL